MSISIESNGISRNGNGPITVTVSSSYERLHQILEKRLPHSCFMYNQLKLHKNPKIEKNLYIFLYIDETLGIHDENDEEKTLWIMTRFPRGDWNQVVTISPPTSIASGSKPISTEVQKFLESGVLCKWSEPFVFIVDEVVSEFVIRLNTRKIYNTLKIFPSHLFYMDPKEALKLEIPLKEGLEMRPVDPSEGEAFIAENWQYTKPGSREYFRYCFENFLNGGLYVNGELVCAAITPGSDGLIECLVTHPSHRRKGYASIVMRYLFREMAKNGFHPCLDAEAGDERAVAFHKSYNPNIISTVQYVCHKALF